MTNNALTNAIHSEFNLESVVQLAFYKDVHDLKGKLKNMVNIQFFSVSHAWRKTWKDACQIVKAPPLNVYYMPRLSKTQVLHKSGFLRYGGNYRMALKSPPNLLGERNFLPFWQPSTHHFQANLCKLSTAIKLPVHCKLMLSLFIFSVLLF